jgi:hypothetical protein
MVCKICTAPSPVFYTCLVLKKYQVNYHKCKECGFIQTEKPFWLSEAYSSAITNLDIGLASRNLYLLDKIPKIIDVLFPRAGSFLDYGGGYGLFVRMMRDAGYPFYRQDIYCENIFAKNFDVTHVPEIVFDVLTTFEVFEHLENPMHEIAEMLKYGNNIVFSTTLAPEGIESFKNWWYLAPSTGQHIAFYTEKSLNFIANHFNLYYYTNHCNLHVFSKSEMPIETIKNAFGTPQPKNLLERLCNLFTKKNQPIYRPSLLQQDFDYIQGLNS